MTKPKILLDADVVIHFIKGEQLLLLCKIYAKHTYVLLEPVYEELSKFSLTRGQMNFLIAGKLLERMSFPEENKEILQEYARLLAEGNGTGESACMAVARYDKSYIASSNLKDILPYCDDHGITYLTTMDFLCAAKKSGLLTEADCDEFIEKVLRKRSKLPVRRMQDYDCQEKI